MNTTSISTNSAPKGTTVVDRRGDARPNPLGFPRNGDIHSRQALIDYFTAINPQNPQGVYEAAQEIWTKNNGWVEPDILTRELMYRQLDPNQPPEQLQKKRALIDQVVAASFPKDSLTNNFHSRENTALVTGLADLHANTVAKKLGKAASVAEADYGNMGGTNNLGRMLSGNLEDPTSGFALTDGAAQIVGNMALVELREAHPEAQFTAVRSGGDEFRIFGFGIDSEQMRATLNNVVRPKMELFLAKAGLGEHPHSKGADDPNRNGFALAWGVGNLQDTLKSSYQIFKDADEEIKFTKKVIGYARHGNLPPEYEEIVRANVRAELSAGGQTPDPDEITRLTQERYARAQMEVTAFAEKLQNVRPHVIDEEAVQRVMNSSEYAKYRPAMERVEVPLAYIPYVGDERAVTADKVLEQRINTFCKDNDIDIADSERATFKLLVDNYRAINPVTGVDLPRDLPSRLELHARYTGPNGEKPRIMSVEFGNTAGFNDNISYGAADAVLRTQANIIKEVLTRNRIPANDVYDLGGGKFNVLTTPITEDQLKTIQSQIAEETQKQINSQTIESFFKDKGIPITDQDRIKLVQAFKKAGVDVTPEEVTKQRISELPHPKRLEERGVDLTMESNELQKGVNGYDQMEEMKKDIERKIEKQRAAKLEEYNKQQQEKNNGQQGRGTQENVGGGSPEDRAANARVSIGGGDGRSVLQGSATRVGLTSTQAVGPTVSTYVGQQNTARGSRSTSENPAKVNPSPDLAARQAEQRLQMQQQVKEQNRQADQQPKPQPVAQQQEGNPRQIIERVVSSAPKDMDAYALHRQLSDELKKAGFSAREVRGIIGSTIKADEVTFEPRIEVKLGGSDFIIDPKLRDAQGKIILATGDDSGQVLSREKLNNILDESTILQRVRGQTPQQLFAQCVECSNALEAEIRGELVKRGFSHQETADLVKVVHMDRIGGGRHYVVEVKLPNADPVVIDPTIAQFGAKEPYIGSWNGYAEKLATTLQVPVSQLPYNVPNIDRYQVGSESTNAVTAQPQAAPPPSNDRQTQLEIQQQQMQQQAVTQASQTSVRPIISQQQQEGQARPDLAARQAEQRLQMQQQADTQASQTSVRPIIPQQQQEGLLRNLAEKLGLPSNPQHWERFVDRSFQNIKNLAGDDNEKLTTILNERGGPRSYHDATHIAISQMNPITMGGVHVTGINGLSVPTMHPSNPTFKAQYDGHLDEARVAMEQFAADPGKPATQIRMAYYAAKLKAQNIDPVQAFKDHLVAREEEFGVKFGQRISEAEIQRRHQQVLDDAQKLRDTPSQQKIPNDQQQQEGQARPTPIQQPTKEALDIQTREAQRLEELRRQHGFTAPTATTPPRAEANPQPQVSPDRGNNVRPPIPSDPNHPRPGESVDDFRNRLEAQQRPHNKSNSSNPLGYGVAWVGNNTAQLGVEAVQNQIAAMERRAPLESPSERTPPVQQNPKPTPQPVRAANPNSQPIDDAWRRNYNADVVTRWNQNIDKANNEIDRYRQDVNDNVAAEKSRRGIQQWNPEYPGRYENKNPATGHDDYRKIPIPENATVQQAQGIVNRNEKAENHARALGETNQDRINVIETNLNVSRDLVSKRTIDEFNERVKQYNTEKVNPLNTQLNTTNKEIAKDNGTRNRSGNQGFQAFETYQYQQEVPDRITTRDFNRVVEHNSIVNDTNNAIITHNKNVATRHSQVAAEVSANRVPNVAVVPEKPINDRLTKLNNSSENLPLPVKIEAAEARLQAEAKQNIQNRELRQEIVQSRAQYTAEQARYKQEMEEYTRNNRAVEAARNRVDINRYEGGSNRSVSPQVVPDRQPEPATSRPRQETPPRATTIDERSATAENRAMQALSDAETRGIPKPDRLGGAVGSMFAALDIMEYANQDPKNDKIKQQLRGAGLSLAAADLAMAVASGTIKNETALRIFDKAGIPVAIATTSIEMAMALRDGNPRGAAEAAGGLAGSLAGGAIGGGALAPGGPLAIIGAIGGGIVGNYAGRYAGGLFYDIFTAPSNRPAFGSEAFIQDFAKRDPQRFVEVDWGALRDVRNIPQEIVDMAEKEQNRLRNTGITPRHRQETPPPTPLPNAPAQMVSSLPREIENTPQNSLDKARMQARAAIADILKTPNITSEAVNNIASVVTYNAQQQQSTRSV